MALRLKISTRLRRRALKSISPIPTHPGNARKTNDTMGCYGGIFRRVSPLKKYALEEVLAFSDEINGLPRKRLAYSTPEELFDAFFDAVYAA